MLGRTKGTQTKKLPIPIKQHLKGHRRFPKGERKALWSLPQERNPLQQINAINKEGYINMKKIFIIGGGIAALEAAKSARSTQRDALIVLISAENALPYSRPMLTKQLMGKVTAQDLAVESAAWYDEKDIVVLTGRTVTAIDPVGKTLVASTKSVAVLALL